MRIIFIILSTLAVTARAQVSDPSIQKIGYAETDYIMSQLSEFKKMDSELQTHYTQLQNELKSKQDEFQAKLKVYNDLPPSTPNLIRADKGKELATLQQSLEKFKQEAQTSYQKKQSDLLNPIYKRIGNAIEQVAVEKGYTFILNQKFASEGQILLSLDEKYNISDLVLKKLGVVPIQRKTLKVD